MADSNQQNGPEANSRVQGDDSIIPFRGTSTGVDDSYGADLSQDATNKMRSMKSDTQSDMGAA